MFKKNFTPIFIIVFALFIFIVVSFITSYNKFNTTLVGSNIKEVRKEWGTPNFQSNSQEKIHLHYRSMFIYKCVFIFSETDSLLIKKWKQLD